MREKRVALVTGGARGIGRATANKLADCGFSVAITYLNSQEQAFELVSKLQSKGVNAMAYKCDLTDYKAVEKLYADCKAYFGNVDTLINNAGVSLIKPLYECTPTDFDAMMNANLRTVFNTTRVFSPDMVSEQFGRIVNVSSVWGEYGGSTETLYSAAKAGVIGFTKATNAELALSNVIVNCVSPGMIDTDMNAHLSEADKQAFLASTALGRVGKPSEVADVIELLTREELYVAGADIPVNGGI